MGVEGRAACTSRSSQVEGGSQSSRRKSLPNAADWGQSALPFYQKRIQIACVSDTAETIDGERNRL